MEYFATWVEAASNITTGLKVRERFETWSGYNKKAYGDDSINPKGVQQGNPDDDFILQRLFSALAAKVTGWPGVHIFMTHDPGGIAPGSDDFVKNGYTDQEHVMDPYEDYVEPYELYAKFKGLGTDKSSLTPGTTDCRFWG